MSTLEPEPAAPAPTGLPADPLIGTRLGEYELLEVVGEGGMGVVYRGLQPVIKKQVAIKVLKPNLTDDTSVKRLIAEAEAVNSIRHRNVIDIFSMGQLPDGRAYIVMEFLNGIPLDVYLDQRELLSIAESLALLIEICEPLAAAHKAGVIHRDLKPSNVFVCHEEGGGRFVKLLDFGLAKRAAGMNGVTAQSSHAVIAGTPDYMAPEQARGLDISPRTDIYALGVLAYRLFTGELPFLGDTPMDVMVAHVGHAIPSAKARAVALPPGVDALVARMLSKAPDDRPQTAAEVRDAMGRELEALVTDPNTPATPVRRVAVSGLRPRLPVSTPGGSPSVSGSSPATSASGRGGVPVVSASAAPLGAPAVGRSLVTGESSNTLLVVRRAPISRRTVVMAAAGGVLLLTVAGAMLLAQRADPPVVVLPQPPPVVPPSQPAQPTADPQPTLRQVEAVELPPDPDDIAPLELPKDPNAVHRPAVPFASVPTGEALVQRAVKLEATLRRLTPRGEDPDIEALTWLNRYRLEATMAPAPLQRVKVARKMDDWERRYLKR